MLKISYINFRNYKGYEADEKNTIEIRCPNGTLDAKIWQNNINFFVKDQIQANNKNYSNNRLSVDITNNLNDKYTIKISNSKMSINDTEKAITTYSSFTTPSNAYIFNASGTYPAGYVNASTKLYYCKIWNGTTLIRDYVPCYRKSDDVIGLYDLENNVFYTNAGTDDFTKGNDIPTRELLFCGIVRNTGNISLNPRHPHYCSLQVLDFKTFLSEGDLFNFVIDSMTIQNAIKYVIDQYSGYNFIVGNLNLGKKLYDKINNYNCDQKTLFDVLDYFAQITNSLWTTRYISYTEIAIDFFDINSLPNGMDLVYDTTFCNENSIKSITYNLNSSRIIS